MYSAADNRTASSRSCSTAHRCAARRSSVTSATAEEHGLTVDVHYTPAERGCPTKFELVLKMPPHLDEEQIERLKVIAAKCPVHRTLEGEVMFHERVELA